VEKGLIMMVSGVHDEFNIPRMKVTEMIQRRIESPQSADSKSDFTYSEKVLQPRDTMVYTEFNPCDYEHV
jgi:hypothetical protein